MKKVAPMIILKWLTDNWWNQQVKIILGQLLLSLSLLKVEIMNKFLDRSNKDTRNCPEKAMKISHFNPNQSAPSIYIMIELCYFSLDQWEIRIHLLWGKSFNIPLHCDPHLNQTKWLIFNDLLPLTIPGVLGTAVLPKPKPNANLSLATGQSMKILKICLRSVRGQDKIFVPVKKWALVDSEAAPLIPVAAALNKK